MIFFVCRAGLLRACGESVAAASGDLTLSSATEALNTDTCNLDCITTNHCYLVYNKTCDL